MNCIWLRAPKKLGVKHPEANFNQEKAISVIVKTDRSFAALVWAGVVAVFGVDTLASLQCRIHGGAFELLTACVANTTEAGEAH